MRVVGAVSGLSLWHLTLFSPSSCPAHSRLPSPVHRCRGQAMTPWWKATGVTSLCTAMPLGSRVVACGVFREMQRDGRRAWPAGQWWPRARGGAGPPSFGSKWRSSEGGETTWTTRQPRLLGLHEAGHEVNCPVGFYKAWAEAVPSVPAAWSTPSAPEFT